MKGLFQYEELNATAQKNALRSCLDKNEKIISLLIKREKSKGIHERINTRSNRYIVKHLNLLKMVQRNEDYFIKFIISNVFMFTEDGEYMPFMYKV
jgi:hypothetical protein